jgi:hypothetical protein
MGTFDTLSSSELYSQQETIYDHQLCFNFVFFFGLFVLGLLLVWVVFIRGCAQVGLEIYKYSAFRLPGIGMF